MPKTMNEAFRELGMRAEYEGDYVTVLPLTRELIDDLGGAEAVAAKAGQNVTPGQLFAHLRKDGQSRGLVLNARAENDLSILVRRTEGDYRRVEAGKADRAYNELMGMARDARREAKAVAEANARAQADYEAAIERGDHVDQPEMATPTYADDAFDFLPHFGAAVREAIGLRAGARVISVAERVETLGAQLEMGRVNADNLTRDEMDRIARERGMREEIGRLNAGHPLALAGPGEAYTQDPQETRELMSQLPLQRGSGRPVALMMPANFGKLIENIFKVMTTTPVHALYREQISPASREAVAQTLGRNRMATFETGAGVGAGRGAGQEWAQAALARVGTVLGGAMEDYAYRAELFSRDGADVMLISDFNGDYIYAWDSASRVAEFDVEGRILSTYTEDDVPSDERLEEVKSALDDVRFDVDGDIDFGWDDEPDAGAAGMTDEDPFDIDGGPTPH